LRDSLYNRSIYGQLKSFLTDTEIQNIKNTVGSAYYTPAPMIQAVYKILMSLGFKGGKILEPAAGNGSFIEHMPGSIRKASQISAVEIEMFSSQFIKALYPDVTVYSQGFECLNLKNEFDLVIGNPPYSSACLFDINHSDLKEYAIHHYFFAKGFRLLKEGGILAFVLPSFCLDNLGRHVRGLIAAEGGRLLQAYRLPDNLFSDAKVTVDLVFIKKDRSAQAAPWQEAVKIEEINGRGIFINEYFLANPQNVLGELKTIDAYGRKILTCRGDQSAYKFFDKLPTNSVIGRQADACPSQTQSDDIDNMIALCSEKIAEYQAKRDELMNIKLRISELRLNE